MGNVQYRIEGRLLFCPNTVGFYHPSSKEELVSVSSPAARLFFFLIKNKGEIVEREVLLQKVWDDYGLQASNNNLNQCLSTLRRIIKSMGVEKNIIETIPKVGLRIANDTLIETIDNTQKTAMFEQTPVKKQPKSRGKINFAYGAITLVIILIVTTLLHIFHLYGHYSQRHYINNFMDLVNVQCEAPASSTLDPLPDLFPPLM